MNMLTKDFTDAVEKQFSALSRDVKDALEEAQVAKGIVADLEQKLARRGGSGADFETKSWGQQFVDADGLKDFAGHVSGPGRFRLDVKSVVTTGSTSGGPLGNPTFRDAPNMMPMRKLTIRDLLPVIRITSGEVEYPKQTTRTNAAAPTAEGTTKPESAYAWAMETVKPKVIAHWIQASRQILEDAPLLAGTIDTELRYGLGLKEEDELLNGDGTGEHLSGLIENSTAYAAPFDPAGTETMIDIIGLAILQNALADEPADGIVVHPSDWTQMRLLKDTQGKYILGAPGEVAPQVLFGLPVVTTKSIGANNFLVGNFQRAATLYDRWEPRVEISTEDGDNFRKNLVTILAEERIALAPKNAAALTYGQFVEEEE